MLASGEMFSIMISKSNDVYILLTQYFVVLCIIVEKFVFNPHKQLSEIA